MDTAEYLLKKYQSLHLSVSQLAEVLHYKSAASLRTAISAETCPVPTFKIAGKRVADVRDVAEYLDRVRATSRQHAAFP
ncbi:MAG TPA: hypothetical protein ENK05_11495 [Gammaproteobacteria bacterium]|nr:hypothetical protein [Gammaproteobacteria bacterium]